MDSFASIIKIEREKRGWLLRQAAANLEIDQSLVCKYENGERRPTREQVDKFAQIYNLDLDELVITWYSDKIVYDLANNNNASEILKVAEEKINYLKSKKL